MKYPPSPPTPLRPPSPPERVNVLPPTGVATLDVLSLYARYTHDPDSLRAVPRWYRRAILIVIEDALFADAETAS